jgi:hypothetical protein
MKRLKNDSRLPLEQAAIDQQAFAPVNQQLVAGAGHPIPAAMMAELDGHPAAGQGNFLILGNQLNVSIP